MRSTTRLILPSFDFFGISPFSLSRSSELGVGGGRGGGRLRRFEVPRKIATTNFISPGVFKRE